MLRDRSTNREGAERRALPRPYELTCASSNNLYCDIRTFINPCRSVSRARSQTPKHTDLLDLVVIKVKGNFGHSTAGHLRFRIDRGDAIDQPLNGKAKTIKHRSLPGKDPLHVPAQRPYKGGDDDHKQHVLNCAVEIHQS